MTWSPLPIHPQSDSFASHWGFSIWHAVRKSIPAPVQLQLQLRRGIRISWARGSALHSLGGVDSPNSGV